MITHALKYLKLGYSVIPCQTNKKAIFSWAEFQHKKPTKEQVSEWWSKYQYANIAIICGEVSGVDVIDCDTEEAFEQFNENFIPDSVVTPIVKTPRGYHIYFKHRPGLSNAVRALDGTDLRTNGGYVVVPPSKNSNGNGYSWYNGLSIENTEISEMPDFVFNILQQASNSFSFNSNINNTIPSTSSFCNNHANDLEKFDMPTTINNIGQQLTTNLIPLGQRDALFFHLANCLVKGGMAQDKIQYFLRMFLINCSEQDTKDPFTERDIDTKIKSALDRQKNRDVNLTEEIRNIVMTTKGNITTTYIHNQQQLTTSDQKKKANVILYRLEKDGFIEKTGRFAGEFRIINQDTKEIDWIDAETNSVKIWLPFELSNLSGSDCIVEIMPGDIILFAGVNNAGKSGVCMNVAKENRTAWAVHYISSELSPGKFRKRFQCDPDTTIDMLRDIKFYDGSGGLNMQDFIRSGLGNLNIIDYLESLKEPWMMGDLLNEVFKKLKGAVAIVAIQRKPDSDTGYGGEYTKMRPSLVINLEEIKEKETKRLLYNQAIITKCKEPTDRFMEERGHPSYMKYNFNLVNKGITIIRKAGWHR